MKRTVILIATVMLAAFSHAALVAYEGFNTVSANGTDAETVGVTGSGFSGYTNTNFRMDIENGLSYSDGSGNTLVTTGKAAGMDVVTPGTQNLQLVLDNTISSGTVYLSYLMRVDTVATWGVVSGLFDAYHADAATPSTEVLFRSTSSNWGIFSNGKIDQRTGSAVSTGTFFVVGEINLDTDAVTFWLNPTDLEDISGTAASTISATASSSLNDLVSFGFSLGGDESGVVDEIRIGTTIGDVSPIPEPATIGMLGLGSLLTLLVRRLSGS